MRSAIWVLSGFAAVWCYLGILGNGWSIWLVAAPLAMSALFIALARGRSFPMRSPNPSHKIRRVLLIWTIAEFAAIAAVTTLLMRWHLEDAVLAAAVIIVGLHFIPLAHGIPAPMYYATGALLIGIGIISLMLAPPLEYNFAAFGAAIILWASVVVLLSKETPREAL